jgi:hypothetical protein
MSDKFFVQPSPCIEYEGGLSLTCPAGNNLADHAAVWMDSWSTHSYTLQQALPQVVCQVCDVLIGVDSDLMMDFVTFDLMWGPNMVNGEINQIDIMGYEVFFVNQDSVDVVGSPVASIAKPPGASENVISSCGCDATKYALSFVSVPVPPGAVALMVVPKDNDGYTMPVGRVIPFTDTHTTSTTTGTSDTVTSTTTTLTTKSTTKTTTTEALDVVVAAEVTSEESLPTGTTEDDLINSVTYVDVKKTALSAALGVPQGNIEITGFTLSSILRRLSSAAGRGLSGSFSVTTAFTVAVADADTAQALATTMSDPSIAETIKTQTNIAAAAADWSNEPVLTSAPTVNSVTAPVVTAVTGAVLTTTRTTTEGVLPPTINSRAPGFAQLSVSVLAFLIAAAATSAQV